MPKEMEDNQRSYKVVVASGVQEKDFGRYLGVKPRDAARKAMKQVFLKVPEVKQPFIAMRETTRWNKSQRHKSQSHKSQSHKSHKTQSHKSLSHKSHKSHKSLSQKSQKLYYYVGERTLKTRTISFPGHVKSNITSNYAYKATRVSKEEFERQISTSTKSTSPIRKSPTKSHNK